MAGKFLGCLVAIGLLCCTNANTDSLKQLYTSRSKVTIMADAASGPSIPDTKLAFVGRSNYLMADGWMDVVEGRLGTVARDLAQQAVDTACSSIASKMYWEAKGKMVAAQLDNAVAICLPPDVSATSSKSGSYFLYEQIRKLKAVNNSISIVVVAPRADLLSLASVVATTLPDFDAKSSAKYTDIDLSIIQIDDNISHGQASADDITALQNVVDNTRAAATLVDMPSNMLNVDAFVAHAEDVAARVGASVETLRLSDLQSRGFGGLVSVGMAAEEEPALVILTHEGSDPSKTIALIGKGIVFDTGGLQIKTKPKMPTMKKDMGGAAGVLHAFESLAKNGFKHKLVLLLCLADNSVGSKASKPDDVIGEADAEGRVAMADGAAYAAKDLNADLILSMGTLTGSSKTAVGPHHAAVTSNEQYLDAAIAVAGRTSADQTYPLIFCPELHMPQLKSDVADMINSNIKYPGATASVAANFVAAQFDFDRPWLNVDMSYPAWIKHRGVGYGVSLLNSFFGKYTDKEILQIGAPDFEI